MTKIQEAEIKKMSKKALILEIKCLYQYIEYLQKILQDNQPKYYLYPPYYIKDEWPYNYPNPLPKWPVTCFTKDQESDNYED